MRLSANPGVVDGICCIYSPHTTCCVRVNEYERGMFEDFGALLRRLIPHETYFSVSGSR